MTKSLHRYQMSIALFLLFCAISLDYLVLSVRADSGAVPSSNREPTPSSMHPLMPPEGLSERVQAAVEKIRPSLVTISSASKRQAYQVMPPLLPEFSSSGFRLFDDRTNFPANPGTNTDRLDVATGVIVSKDGFIWTSSDVVQGLDSVTVTLKGNGSYDGKVILSDPESGLGIVKISADKLPAAQLTDTAQPKPADWAVAVAVDDRQEPILAAGLISSVKRLKSDTRSRMETFRCSFPVAAEFAGCPIVNLDGSVIGINVAKPSMCAGAITSCDALQAACANELQRTALQNSAVGQQASGVSALNSHDITQKRKEATSSQMKETRHLFSVPRSEWTPASIANSVRNWLDSWQNADDPRLHSIFDGSELR